MDSQEPPIEQPGEATPPEQQPEKHSHLNSNKQKSVRSILIHASNHDPT